MCAKKVSKTKSRKKKSNKNSYNTITSKNILYACIIGIVLAAIIIGLNKYEKKSIDENECYCNNSTAYIKSKSDFTDNAEDHLRHAKVNGIKTIIKDQEHFNSIIDSLINENILVQIKPNRYYNLGEQNYSLPYLTKEAEDLLNLIGIRFQRNLQQQDFPKYKFQIISLLRTKELQKRLKDEDKIITTKSSSHLYGTSFDISYNKFYRRGGVYKEISIEEILEKTLIELRKECRLLVSKNTSRECFHITVVNKAN